MNELKLRTLDDLIAKLPWRYKMYIRIVTPFMVMWFKFKARLRRKG